MSESFAERLAIVRERIQAAARAAGRDPSEIRLIAVSKLQPVSALEEAYAAGLRDFGENYVQELVEKSEALSKLTDLRFHLIGHLQRNKVNAVLPAVSMIQTIDTLRLAQAIAQRWQNPEPLPVLVEVNVGGEEQKSGCEPRELGMLLEQIQELPQLSLKGLMTVPPFTIEPEEARRYFDALAELRLAHGGPARLPELSMGMTADLEPAIMAGATMVRVGTALFGERHRGAT